MDKPRQEANGHTSAQRAKAPQCSHRCRASPLAASSVEAAGWLQVQAPVAGYIADFLCVEMKVIVELDGGQHLEKTDYYKRRTLVLGVAGYQVLRYWNDDALLRTADVLEDILRNLDMVRDDNSKMKSTPPQSSPGLRAREEAESSNRSNSNSEGDET
jgi:very-short-patch-repair endonuclease